MEGIPQALQAFYIFIALLPGFVTLLVHMALSYQRQVSGPIVIAKALMYSVIVYALFSTLRVPLVLWTLNADGKAQQLSLVPTLKSIAILLLIASALGAVVGLLWRHDIPMRIARRLGITTRSARQNIWLDAFHDFYPEWQGAEVWVTVELTDGRRVKGWPRYFADEFENGPVLLLSNAVWLGRTVELGEIPEPGIMLNGSMIGWIQFHGDRDATAPHSGDESS